MSDKKPVVVSVIGDDFIAKKLTQLLSNSKLGFEVVVASETEDKYRNNKEPSIASEIDIFNLLNKKNIEQKIKSEYFPKQRINKKIKNRLNNRQKSFINKSF